MSIDLDLLPTFAVFAEVLSFTETGRRCALTQPAVHGQVKRLAEAAGGPLYVRDGRGLRLTPRGVELAALARRVVAERDAFLSRTPRTVRLAAGRGAWTWWLADQLRDWIRAHGVQPVTADGPTAIEGVRTGRFELGVATDPGPGFATHPLREVGTVLLVPPGDPLAGRGTVSLAEVGDRRWVLPARGRPHRTVMEALFERAGIAWAVGAEADDWLVAGRFVALGCGIAAVNDPVEVAGCARVVLVDGPRHTYRLFWRDDARPPPLPQ
ncbi:MAG: LysR family transcriptional regulator [Alphaproteobacteria bacterium]|nr:LysR family transcriptional regulator [Alphaproteobacteria bacterium]